METKEIPIYKPKLRIQLMDPQGIVLSDRLVDQAIEFMNGPKVGHDGPLRVEVNLTSKQDIDSFINYIQVLKSGLPNKEVGKQGRKPNASIEMASPREEILQEVEGLIEQGENQDNIISYLRKLGFIFMLTEDFLWYFPGFPFKGRDIGDKNSSGQYLGSYSWMVRRIKMGKDPKTDKYDPQIIFGIQMIGERTAKFVCYLYKERKRPLSADLPVTKGLSFSNTEMTKYPKYMTEEERLKFNTETRQMLVNPEKKPSKFFLRWYSDVVFPKDLKPKVAEVILRK